MIVSSWTKASGVYFDGGKMRSLNHVGRYFSIAGRLNFRHPPQRAPEMVQARLSNHGQRLAAETIELLFTAQLTLADAGAFHAGDGA